MLALDIGNLSESQLSREAAGRCARFGTVKHIKILLPASHRSYAIAAVEMSNTIEAEKLRVGLGDSKIGPVVMIRLVPEQDSRPQDAASPDEEPLPDVRRAREPVDILLVEDDPADVRMTREALNAAGLPHRLHVVNDGLEAISFLCRTRQFDAAPRPHVVLVDLNLPKVNGHEVLLEIKSNDDLRDIPVIVLTSSHAQRDIRLSYQAEADWFVTKPTGLDAYADTMKRIEKLIFH
ncbi:MAG: response regulator receiver protein [Betaproteobacteria bacterium]|nr:response regulator receiver protein [Betaproteobacteria bacterium]